MKDFTVFSLADIRAADPGFHRRRLNEWQQKGYIKKIIKGYYVFASVTLSEKNLFEIANRIYDPSYVSLETALSHYGLIPESVYGVTCISTRRTYRFCAEIAQITYRHCLPRLFFGYDLVHDGKGKYFKMACAEKALLDYLYSHPSLKNEDDFDGLRLSNEGLQKVIDEDRLHAYLDRFAQKSLDKRLKQLWRTLSYA